MSRARMLGALFLLSGSTQSYADFWEDQPSWKKRIEIVTTFPVSASATYMERGMFDDPTTQQSISFDIKLKTKPTFRLGQEVDFWSKLAQLDRETRLVATYGFVGYAYFWNYLPYIGEYNKTVNGAFSITPLTILAGIPVGVDFRFGREGDPDDESKHFSTVLGGGLMPYFSFHSDDDAALVGTGITPFVYAEFGFFTSWRNFKIRGTYYFGNTEYGNSAKDFIGLRQSQYELSRASLTGGSSFAISLVYMPGRYSQDDWH